MFEIPECMTLSRQMAEGLLRKRIVKGALGNSPHRFVWYNRKPEEFAALVASKTVGEAYCRGKWIFIPVLPGYVIVFGECGGRILLHADESQLPEKYHLSLHFQDGSAFSATTQMWGAMELYESGKELERQYIKGMRPTPTDTGFTLEQLEGLIGDCVKEGNRSVKGLLTQDQLIPGLGNSIAQDIMFKAKLSPKHPLADLEKGQIKDLYEAIVGTVTEAARMGGRNDEIDLYGNPGKYRRIMDKDSVGKPCPYCGTRIVKITYLGGACYYCPGCQS